MSDRKRNARLPDLLATWGWLIALVGVVGTMVIYGLWRPCWPAFALGYLVAVTLVYVLCKVLQVDPFEDPPAPGDPVEPELPGGHDIDKPANPRLRLINCGPGKHLKRLRLRVKLDPAGDVWSPPQGEEPLELPIDPELGPTEWREPPVDITGPWFGVKMSVEAVQPGNPNQTDLWTNAAMHVQEQPIEKLTMRYDPGGQLEPHPGVLLEQCP